MSGVRTFFPALLACVALLVGACSGDPVTRTQLTFVIGASQELQERTHSLRVDVRSTEDQVRDFHRDDLDWPVQIVVVARDNGSTSAIVVRVRAYDADMNLLADEQASGRFTPEKVNRVQIALDEGAELPEEDAGPTDPEMDGGQPPQRDGGDAQAPRDAGADGNTSPGVNTCATPNSGIKCDDSNPCNGVENCDPNNSNADVRGCVAASNPKSCPQGQTCDRDTGECSACLVKADGDGDGAASISCGGSDCDDNDEMIAPGKPEKCDGKDNDCDGTVDGAKADALCDDERAPVGGSASCGSTDCVLDCDEPSYQPQNGMCVPPPVTCPISNPCAPGSCMGGSGTYTCDCPETHRSGVGMTRCAPAGVPLRTIGFETACDETPLADFVGERRSIAPMLFASCGTATITSGSLNAAVELIRPLAGMTMIDGLSGETALVVPRGVSTETTIGPGELVISFSPAVTELKFELLDLENEPGLNITLFSGAATIVGTLELPALGSTRRLFSYSSATAAINRVSLQYSPAAETDELYLDQLSYRVAGCGDNVMGPGEACDDGNSVQCDGCDNACAVSVDGCLDGSACLAGGANSGDSCRTCDLTAAPVPGGDILSVRRPGAPASCAP